MPPVTTKVQLQDDSDHENLSSTVTISPLILLFNFFLSDISVIIIITLGIAAGFSLILNLLLAIALIKKCKHPGKLIMHFVRTRSSSY